MKNIFDLNVSNEVIERINKLSNPTTPSWGKMVAAQMLAHCNVTYEFLYEDKHSKPNPIAKFFLKLFVKNWNNMFYKHLDHHLSQFGV